MAGTSLSDTTPAAAAEYHRLLARLTPAERLRRVRELTVSAGLLALAGLRGRHPGAGERELLLRMAALRLGDDLVERAYGWRAGDDGP